MPLHVGTAGYVYPHWRHGAFYPPRLHPTKELPHYLSHFPVVEINATYHAFPRRSTLLRWRSLSPPRPTFFLKSPAAITHHARLRNASADILSFCTLAADALGPAFAGVLFQCPPSLRKDLDLLRAFLADICAAREQAAVPFRVALELRAPDWFCSDVYALLDAAQVALVDNVCVRDDDFTVLDRDALPQREGAEGAGGEQGAGWTYTRFHGSKAPGVCTRFPDGVLKEVADGVAGRRGEEAYVFFLNDREAEAPRSARKFVEIVAGGRGVKEVMGGFVPAWTRKKVDIALFFGKRGERGTMSKDKEKGKPWEDGSGGMLRKGGDGMTKGVGGARNEVGCGEEGEAVDGLRNGSPATLKHTELKVSGSKEPQLKVVGGGIKKSEGSGMSRKLATKDISSFFAPGAEKG